MKFPLVPDFYFESIHAIDLARLRARGVRLLLADLDNTLVPYGVHTPTQPVRAWKQALDQAGITLFLLSNSRKPGRAQRFAEALGIPYEGHAGKPKVGGFQRAMARMGAAPEETAIVGDQIFTDIWGGNRAGVLTLLVHPSSLAPCFEACVTVWDPFRAGAGKGRGCEGAVWHRRQPGGVLCRERNSQADARLAAGAGTGRL
ncbi:MAG: YqeG family HAD IIIA-type phosphatase [Evtepia gabavorous]